MRRSFAVEWLSLLALVAALGCGERPALAPLTTEVLWDGWGVPHIYALDAERLFHAHGWAQARAHGDLLLRLYGEARGRAAEYWGAEHRAADVWVRTVGIPARAEEWYRHQGRFKPWLDAFARGVNDYAAAHPEAIADEVEGVLPVDGRDVLAHLQRVVHFTFLVDRWSVSGAAARWPDKGSNGWAVAPSRSTSGHALLLANPHLPWSGRFRWFEVHLVAPELEVYGAALVGSPFVGLGFNRHLAWTHTVNTHDGADLYELTVTPDGYGYLLDGDVVAFEVEEQLLALRRADGSLAEERLIIKRSIHGPVVAEKADDAGGGKALALRVVGLDDSGLFEQYWDMAAARDLDAFEAALRRLQMPMFTVLYADRHGHVLHLFGGRTPVRPGGVDDWSGIVDGTRRETLWTETHVYDELPRIVDPPSGWLQNANDPPWTTTVPLAIDADRYPKYLAPRFMPFRAQQSAELLRDELQGEDALLTLDELVAAKHSTRMALADRILDDLAAAVESHGAGDGAAAAAMAVLDAWDRRADAASRGAVLFARFAGEAGLLIHRGDGAAFAERWSEERPLATPDGLADPAAAVEALRRAARSVVADHGALDVPWGDVHRLRLAGKDLPASGGPGSLGIFRVLGFTPQDDGRRAATSGDSFVAAIELADPPRARALLSYGNATQPGSPHLDDQLELLAAQQLRPVWFERAAVEAHSLRRETLPPD